MDENNEKLNGSGSQETAQLEACQIELAQLKERSAYLHAEFDNFKKRTEKDRLNWIEMSQDAVLTDLLSIVDDFERAFSQVKAQKLPPAISSHLEGFEFIVKNTEKLLKKYDVEEIPSTNQFDPEKFEAIMQVQSQEHASGDIVTILQKGYTRRGKILRPGKVSVAE